MHFLVLSAFRRVIGRGKSNMGSPSLNAPFGAQCFPTAECGRLGRWSHTVSMHLLVLSAFRRWGWIYERGVARAVSMHLLVLSAFRRRARLGR